MKTPFIATLLFSATLSIAAAKSITIPVMLTSNGTSNIGTVTATDTQYGLLLTPHLHGLKPGLHGFHIHTNPSCKNHGMAAGGHFDPNHTGKHLGPYNPNGHLGDLPALYVNPQGWAVMPVLAPRLTVAKIEDHALMIHADGDNYADYPKKDGGGGKRIACGVIQ